MVRSYTITTVFPFCLCNQLLSRRYRNSIQQEFNMLRFLAKFCALGLCAGAVCNPLCASEVVLGEDYEQVAVIAEKEMVLNDKERKLIAHVKKSIDNAHNEISKLTNDVLSIDGMSSPKVRHLLNNLCSRPDVSHLEIGAWKGSTWIGALYGNAGNIKQAVAVDSWVKQAQAIEKDFQANCAKYLPGYNYKVISQDAFKLDLKSVFEQKVNNYFYDADTTAKALEQAFTYYNSAFEDVFVVVIDDWNWTEVRKGTLEAFKKLGYEVLYDASMLAKFVGDRENWWNGLYVAVVRKPKA